MKVIHFYTTMGIGAACILLAIITIGVAKGNQGLRKDLQAQMRTINEGNTSGQVLGRLLQEVVGPVALNDPQIKDMLQAKLSLTVQGKDSATPAPSPAQ